MITVDEFEAMVRRCLEHGVPTGIVAAIFGLDESLVKQAKTDMFVTEYGTADQSEFLAWLEWKTLERCYQIVQHGTPAEVTKVATTVLGRQIARQAKMTGETQRQAAEALTERMEAMRQGQRRPEAPSRFVVKAPEDG